MNLARFNHNEQDAFEMMQHYRATFSGSSGQVVLKDILEILYFFNDDVPGGEIASELTGKRNAAMEMIQMLGGYFAPESMKEELISGMLNVPLIKPEVQNEEDK